MTDDVIEKEPEVEIEDVEADEVERVEQVEDDEADNDDDAADEPELTVQIGDDEPEEQERAPEWVRDLRKQSREKDKRIRELEAAQEQNSPQSKLGDKPTLESCDYDNTLYEEKLEGWYKDKSAHDAIEQEAKEQQKKADERWQGKLATYENGKAELGADDYEDAEAVILETFNQTQQGIMVQGAEKPALLAYALGKNPTKAKALAAITDPVEFAFAVAKTEAQLKVSKRGAPAPEKKVKGGTANLSGTVDGQLDRLREEAAKSGDFSKVAAYKRQQRANA